VPTKIKFNEVLDVLNSNISSIIAGINSRLENLTPVADLITKDIEVSLSSVLGRRSPESVYSQVFGGDYLSKVRTRHAGTLPRPMINIPLLHSIASRVTDSVIEITMATSIPGFVDLLSMRPQRMAPLPALLLLKGSLDKAQLRILDWVLFGRL